MRSTLKALAGLCLLLLTGACLVETEATLGDADPKTFEPRLVGTWYAGEGGEVLLISIVRDEQSEGTYRAVIVNVNPASDGAIEGTRYSVTRTIVNGQPYLNIRRTGGSITDSPALFIASYDFGADGTLVLRMMESKVVIAAIEAGKLKGTFKKGQYVDDVKISSPRVELAAFIAASDRDTLFALKLDPLRKLADTRK